MHINWNSKIRMPAFEDTELRGALTRFVSQATDDDLLAAFLHMGEGTLIRRAFFGLSDFHNRVEAEHKHICHFRSEFLTPTTRDCSQAHKRLQDAFAAQLAVAEAAMEEVRTIWHTMRALSGGNLAERHHRSNPGSCAEIDRVARLVRVKTAARQHLDAATREHREAMHDIAIRDAEFRAFTATTGSISKSEFDAMTPTGFEQATATLARRDGLIVSRHKGGPRDLGADVIAHAPDGRKIVFQCKHRRPGGRPLGSRVIQTLNGTARPVHNADIVIAVTNTSFSEPAHKLARDQNIHLVWGFDLIRWATWGVPLLNVLDPAHPVPDDSAR
ncbi:hypothetical protein AR457_41040 [Streptomyces agglomeratus]|uniref:restriction endonuclease n=1 Tax=Streptomyces agglomeratus TaxID=285458 RepID=UPI0008543510|nr:restriction endonuclease [Streptomyces agglomeratus]OEJ21815.1 hypothetical protein AR457_41040 [Streptomyces agglomeratus]